MSTRKLVRAAFEKCLKAVDPRVAVREAIPSLNLPQTTKIIVISFGKASIQMALGAHDHLNSRIQKTIILAPEQQKSIGNTYPMDIHFGARDNLPDENSVEATRHLIQEIQKEDSEATVFLFLISGGGSALLTAPRVPLKDKLEVIKIMQAHGATIQELNTVRQKLSDVKGGKILKNIKKGQSISLIISDVIGNPIDLIASGPTVIPNGQADISKILGDLKIRDLPDSVKMVLGEEEEAPITGNPINLIISSNSTALSSISNSMTSSGFHTLIVTSSLSGNATVIGKLFAELINSDKIENHGLLYGKGAGLQYPLALIYGGETTVILKGNGKGGRNQEMVLACLKEINDKPPYDFVFLSAGTDGQDGPTDAAGAIISSEDLKERDTVASYLENSDSYNFWKKHMGGESHLITGSSGTNVMDIQILVLDRKLDFY